MNAERYHELSWKANNSKQLVVLGAINLARATRTILRLLKKQKQKLTAEEFGGIEFVRLCSLPSSQKKVLRQSPASKKIITILRGKELLYDCLSYKDYCDCCFNLEK